jgi:hypothetical protein
MILELRTADKTFTTETIDISFGVIEDIIDVLDFDNITDTKQVGIAVLKCSKQLKPFLMELFDGVTPEQLRTVKTSNIIEIFKRIYRYITAELGVVGEATKN